MHENAEHHLSVDDERIRELMMRDTWRGRLRRVFAARRAPENSGERKYALRELQHIYSFLSALVLPLLIVLCLVLLPTPEPREELYAYTWMPAEPPEEPVPDPPPEPEFHIIAEPDVDVDMSAWLPTAEVPVLYPEDRPSPPPLADSERLDPHPVRFARGPLLLPVAYVQRGAGGRERALEEGKSPAGTEGAVLRALRWLKREQETDGSWLAPKPAMTGLALLCFLAHGETPSSAEFGKTVRRGLTWLSQATFDWDAPWGQRPLYYWYYATQAHFHAGGVLWKRWNSAFARELMGAQRVLPAEGLKPEAGYWTSPSEAENHGPVYSTALCTLMLEVYYRYLNTYEDMDETDAWKGWEAQPGNVIIEVRVPVETAFSPAFAGG